MSKILFVIDKLELPIEKIEITEEVHLPKLPTPKFMSIVNPLDISFGADKVTVQNDNKAFHKMKTYHPYENTCNTSNNMNMLTETETNGNIIKIINYEYYTT